MAQRDFKGLSRLFDLMVDAALRRLEEQAEKEAKKRIPKPKPPAPVQQVPQPSPAQPQAKDGQASKKRQRRPRTLDLPAEGFCSVYQIAHAFGVTNAQIYLLVRRGEIPPPLHDGRRSIWPVEDVRAAIAKKRAALKSDVPSTERPGAQARAAARRPKPSK